MPQPLPQPPAPGDPLEAAFGAAVSRALAERTVRGGPGILVRGGPGGTVVSLAPEIRSKKGAPPTDTAVADASADSPQMRSIEVRTAAAADAEAGTSASPAALELHGFAASPAANCGILTVAVPEEGAPHLVPPDGDANADGKWAIPMRRIDGDSRELVWATFGAEAQDGSGGDGPEPETPPPCGHPMNEEDGDPTPGGGAGEGGEPTEDEDGGELSPDLDEGDPTPGGNHATDDNPLDSPGDGGYTPACGGEAI